MSQLQTLYSPYGAYELKASYHRNLFIGNIFILLFMVGVLLTVWIISLFQPPPDLTKKQDDPKVIDLGRIPPQTSFRIDRASTSPSIEQLRGQIPVAVPDEELLDDEDVLIYSQDELARRVNNNTIPIDDGAGGGNFVIDSNYFEDPPPDTFIAVEKPPEMISYRKPEYPRFCKKAGIEGTVVVKVLVTIEGIVKKAIVTKTSENVSLDESALAAAYENTFSPAIQNGIPIPIWVAYTVEFKLNR